MNEGDKSVPFTVTDVCVLFFFITGVGEWLSKERNIRERKAKEKKKKKMRGKVREEQWKESEKQRKKGGRRGGSREGEGRYEEKEKSGGRER